MLYESLGNIFLYCSKMLIYCLKSEEKTAVLLGEAAMAPVELNFWVLAPLATLKSKVLPIQLAQDTAASQKCCL